MTSSPIYTLMLPQIANQEATTFHSRPRTEAIIAATLMMLLVISAQARVRFE